MIKRIKKTAPVVAGGLVAAYLLNGLAYSLSEQTFCGTVNRFVVTNGQDERVSITPHGGTKSYGYNIRNAVYVPFILYFGAERRKEQLTIGQPYQFTSLGWRRPFPRSIPIIVKHEPVSTCAAGNPQE